MWGAATYHRLVLVTILTDAKKAGKVAFHKKPIFLLWSLSFENSSVTVAGSVQGWQLPSTKAKVQRTS